MFTSLAPHSIPINTRQTPPGRKDTGYLHRAHVTGTILSTLHNGPLEFSQQPTPQMGKLSYSEVKSPVQASIVELKFEPTLVPGSVLLTKMLHF